ncbi:hypothetical protein HXX76_015515 [Chlamydomonas incerta]|uniref:TFIIS N-terminal domain-containing protein n=1 Tax=Chlamydomonas incerta TaxID=51695 RepID=A0A835VPP4_CHLIN|nr:hypothetical protein HXX76_015515 [Chlamydomonas incerta]|eukprot:KAG2423130.1 hypothetical protein HXX76_015515 [Chlamydomonas incerta]
MGAQGLSGPHESGPQQQQQQQQQPDVMEKGQQQEAQQQQQASGLSREEVQRRAEALAWEVLVRGLREATAGTKPGRRGRHRNGVESEDGGGTGASGDGVAADADADNGRGGGGGPQPRPHQVEAVAALLSAVYWDPLRPPDAPPANYLLQHSTGSGKSFTIAALATALAGWRDGGGGGFGTVLVLNDRLQLDLQLGACVEAFWRGNGRPPGGLRRAATTRELAGFLAAPPGSPGRPAVVLTTVQKLATLWRARGGRVGAGAGGGGGGGGRAGGRKGQAAMGGEAPLSRIAVIADEAHRHHGHGTTDQIHQILAGALAAGGCSIGSSSEAAEETAVAAAAPGPGSRAAAAAAAAAAVGGGSRRQAPKSRPQQRRQPRGVTYAGFTATPSPKALELFGVATEVPEGGKEEGADAAGGAGAGAGGSGGGGIEAALGLEADGGGSRKAGSGGAALLYTPYHAYTMRNAIQDGFVLDVLRSYTAVTPRLQLAAAAAAAGTAAGPAGATGDRGAQEQWGGEAEAEEAAAQEDEGGGGGGGVAEEVLVEAASNSREVVERKAAYIVQRFLALWRAASAAGYRCLRGMVVARSRQHVAWYTQALRQAVEQEPEFGQLEEAAAAADPSDAAAAARGPSVYGAFSGAVQLPAAELAALRRRLGQQRLERWRRWRAGLQGGQQGAGDVEMEEEEDGQEDGQEEGEGGRQQRRRRPAKRRWQEDLPASAWDTALAHLDEGAEEEEAQQAADEAKQAHPRQGWRRRRRGQAKGDSEEEEEREAGCEESEDEEEDQEGGSSSGSASASAGVSDSEYEHEEEETEESEEEEGATSVGAEEDEEDEDDQQEQVEEVDGGGTRRRGARLGRRRLADSALPHVDDPGGSGGDGNGGGGSGCLEGEKEGGRGAAAAARKRPRPWREGSLTLTGASAGDGLSGLSSGAAVAPLGGGAAAGAAAAGGDAAAGPGTSLFGPADSSAGAAAAAAAANAAGAAHGHAPAVRRQASRLTVTSRAAAAPGDRTEAAAEAAVAAADETGGGEESAAPEDAACPDGLDGEPGGSSRRSCRPRRLTRASSSTAVAGLSAAQPQQQQQRSQVKPDAKREDAGTGEEEEAEAAEEVVLVPVTEAELNGGGGGGGRGAAGADPRAARLLVVCSKYETGYDDPRLGALFIDRTLTGSRAVQVLGRLNRPGPGLGKAPALLGVVDFVNGVGALREAFEEFYDVTYLHTGKHARRLRQERQMERALCRVLEALQPAADRAAAAAAATAATANGANTSATAAAAAGGGGGGNLMAMGVREMAAAAAAHLPPESRRALEADLGAYVSLAAALRLELPELPHVFAAALLARLVADREARERQAAALGLAAAAAAAAGGEDEDADAAGLGAGGAAAAKALSAVQVAVCELEETFSGAICLAGPSPLGLLPTAAGAAGAGGPVAGAREADGDRGEAGAGQGAAGLAGTAGGVVLGGRGFLAASLARGSSRSKSIGGSSTAPAASAAAAGSSTALSRFGLAAAASAPLRGRPIGGAGSSRRGGKGGRGGGGSSSADPRAALDRKVRKNRPISEVIAAANAALDGAYERRLAAGFRDMCARLAAANAAAAAAAAATATTKEAANGDADAAAAAAGAAAGATADSYELLSLLRRLSMWPVGVDQLRATAVGREVAALKKHECPQVASLARTLIARWKAVAASHAATTAAAAAATANGGAGQDGRKPAGGGATAQRAGSATPSSTAAAAAAAAAIDEGLRTRARAMLADALKTHAAAAAAVAAAKAAKAARAAREGGAAPPAAPPPADPERLAEAARALEDAVFGVHGREGAAYKAQTRALVAALKHADGVARGLLAGSTAAAELAAADSMALAPPRVRAQAEEMERKKRQEMEAWEKLSGQGGGASTYKSGGTVCPACGGAGATVHNVLSGGTYAQERVQIQKFVCDHCGSTWRND